MTETETTTGRQQIGTVRITRTRSYPLDPSAPDHLLRAEVLVEPGEYPVYQDGLSHYWRMTGVINHRHYRMGDGMFAMNPGDEASGDDVVFYSRRYGPDEWNELLAEFAAEAEPRLVLSLSESTR
jgi:hypothetical protein